MAFSTIRRRLVPSLLVAMVLALAWATPASARTDGTEIDPNGPCYVSPGVCLSFDLTTRTYTAFSLLDVTTTPYYISIHNVSTGTQLVACGTGFSCETPPMGRGPRGFCHTIKAYIGSNDAAQPPSTVVRESAPQLFCGRLF